MPHREDCVITRKSCRRVERRLTTLHRAGDQNTPSMRYVNRLSDLLFIMARYACHNADGGEEHAYMKPISGHGTQTRVISSDK